MSAKDVTSTHAQASEASALVTTTPFDFEGDRLDVVPLPDGDVGVCLRRLAEAIGVAYSGQYERLRRATIAGVRWATVRVMRTVAEDGKPRQMVVLPRQSIPMWAATIDLGRVAKKAPRGLIEKLVRYQDTCAEVLAEHFLEPALDTITALRAEREELRARVELLADTLSPGVIGGQRASAWILGTLREAARIRCALDGDSSDKAFRRAFKKSENHVRRLVGYPANLGKTWAALPLDRYGEAVSKALAVRAGAERDWKHANRAELRRVKAGQPRQT